MAVEKNVPGHRVEALLKAISFGHEDGVGLALQGVVACEARRRRRRLLQ